MPICADCLEDSDLVAFVSDNLTEPYCDYCERNTEDEVEGDDEAELIAADTELVLEHMVERVEANYSTVDDECMPYDSEEGEYILPTWDTYDLFYDQLEGFPTSNDALIKDIIEHFPDVLWCKRDPQILSPFEGIKFGWEQFCETIKHGTRFMFFPALAQTSWEDIGYEPNAISPGEMLSRIESLIKRHRLVTTISAGSIFFRARCSNGQVFDAPTQLGPPPKEKASGGRMNPLGIVMTYVAEDAKTAIAEAAGSENTTASVGRWQTLEVMRVLDLTNLPQPVGIFAESSGTHSSDMISFLQHFRRTIMTPTHDDARTQEHLEYIPSQVVTEYLRLRYSDAAGPLQGIRYPSVKGENGVNIVFFITQDAIEGGRSHLAFSKPKLALRLLDVAQKKLS